MIGHSRILDPDLRSPSNARLITRRLLTKATYRLRHNKLYAKRLSLGVRTTNKLRWYREINLSYPAHDPFTFLQHLDLLWKQMMNELLLTNPSTLTFKKVSTHLLALQHSAEITEDLFCTNKHAATKTINLICCCNHAGEAMTTRYTYCGNIFNFDRLTVRHGQKFAIS